MWIDIEKLIKEEKVFPSIEMIKHLSYHENLLLTISCDENHRITGITS